MTRGGLLIKNLNTLLFIFLHSLSELLRRGDPHPPGGSECNFWALPDAWLLVSQAAAQVRGQSHSATIQHREICYGTSAWVNYIFSKLEVSQASCFPVSRDVYTLINFSAVRKYF